MEILSLLITIMVIAMIWVVLKFILKLTVKVFSCGCLVIVAIGLLLFALGSIQPPLF